MKKSVFIAILIFALMLNILAFWHDRKINDTLSTTTTHFTTSPTVESTTIFTEETTPTTEPPMETIPPETSPITAPTKKPKPPIQETLPPIEDEEPSSGVIWYSDYRVYPTNTPTTTAGGYSFSREFLAKMVNREASGMSWEGKVYTCSAILNFCDRYKISLNKAGHNKNCFAVAPYVDKAKPTEEDYAVVDYVLNGGRIGEICHFKRGSYHDSFPNIPVCQVGVHYFSIREKRSE